jgi:poly-gamma-glutamate capsule biosynthesis protein CapA/YwtB (metallophosphatase superfamily)
MHSQFRLIPLSHPQRSVLFLLFASIFLLSACSDYAKTGERAPVSIVNSVPAGTEPPPSVTPSSTRTPVPTPSPTRKLPPTVRPTVALTVPGIWAETAAWAITMLEASGTEWQWKVQDAEDGGAQIVMKIGSEGISAGQRPLALAVPFTTDLAAVSMAEAEDILSNGRAELLVIDYADIPAGYKALRVDGQLPHDEGYGLQQEWSLTAAPGFEAAASELAQVMREAIENDPIVQIIAVGDIMLDRALGYAIEQGDIAYPFALVAEHLSAADITIGNLESAMGDSGQPAAKSYTFLAPSAAAESLAGASFDLMSLANNHAMDFGPETLAQAITLLDQQEIVAVGAGLDSRDARAPHLMEVNGISLAILGYVNVPVEASGFDTATWEAGPETPGLAWARPEDIVADVSAARQIADLVIVILHSGYEYVEEPSAEQRAAAEAAVAAGAHLVIGHHAHVLQGIGFLDEGVVVYGLGNFAFEIDGDPSTAILHVWLGRNGVRHLELVPAIVQFGGQPRLAETWEQAEIRRRVYRLTDLLNRQSPYVNAGG